METNPNTKFGTTNNSKISSDSVKQRKFKDIRVFCWQYYIKVCDLPNPTYSNVLDGQTD